MAGWMIREPQTSKRSMALWGKLQDAAATTLKDFSAERGFRSSLAAYRHGSTLDPAGGCSRATAVICMQPNETTQEAQREDPHRH